MALNVTGPWFVKDVKFNIKYNARRLHSTIEYKTPNEVYFEYINNLGFEGEKLLQIEA